MLQVNSAALDTPEANLAFDEALLADLDSRGEVLRFWESPSPVVVLGLSSKLLEEVDLEACAREQVPVLRRASGGGAVVLGPGCLNYSLVLSLDHRPELRDIRRSYSLILGRIAAALGIDGVEVQGASDLALGGRKFSGNSQKRTAHGLLHHGTVLHSFDLDLIARLLREPARRPSYRQDRPHATFLCNLPLAPQEIQSHIIQAWLT